MNIIKTTIILFLFISTLFAKNNEVTLQLKWKH